MYSISTEIDNMMNLINKKGVTWNPASSEFQVKLSHQHGTRERNLALYRLCTYIVIRRNDSSKNEEHRILISTDDDEWAYDINRSSHDIVYTVIFPYCSTEEEYFQQSLVYDFTHVTYEDMQKMNEFKNTLTTIWEHNERK